MINFSSSNRLASKVMDVGLPLAPNPLGRHRAGCPVRLVIWSCWPAKEGVIITSYSFISACISSISRLRCRLICMYSTAGINRAARKILGQALLCCATIWSSSPSRVRSSNAAAPSTNSMDNKGAALILIFSSTGWRVIPWFFKSSRTARSFSIPARFPSKKELK